MDRLVKLLCYAIVNSDAEAIMSIIPENMSKFEVSQLVIGVYGQALDDTVFELKKGLKQKNEVS